MALVRFQVRIPEGQSFDIGIDNAFPKEGLFFLEYRRYAVEGAVYGSCCRSECRMNLRRTAVGIITGILILVAGGETAFSFVCPADPPSEKLRKSKVSIYGQVENIERGKEKIEAGVTRFTNKRVKLKVIQVLKGQAPQLIRLKALADESPSNAFFIVGSKYLLFFSEPNQFFADPCNTVDASNLTPAQLDVLRLSAVAGQGAAIVDAEAPSEATSESAGFTFLFHAVPKDWERFEGQRFSMMVPPDLVRKSNQGVDSSLTQLRGSRIQFDIRYGLYVGTLPARDPKWKDYRIENIERRRPESCGNCRSLWLSRS
jgi:hypothetical protein